MKKILKILFSILFVLIVTVLTVPYFFKDDIEKFIKKEINNSINAKFTYDDISLSLLSDFPNLHVKIDNIRLDGINEFKDVRLAQIDRFNMSLDAKRLFFAKDLVIKKIGVDGADINIMVLKNGKANYDIVKPDSTQTQKPEKNYVIKLKSYDVKNTNLKYDDQSLGMLLKIKNLNHKGTGVFTKSAYRLTTQSQMDTLDVKYDKIHYLNNVKAHIDAGILIEKDFSKYTIQKALISLNDLQLLTNMMLELKGDDVDMDITYQTKENKLKKLLSLVPKAYMPDFQGLKADGESIVKGFVQGVYNDKNYPAYGVDFSVTKGFIQYPDLPQAISNIDVLMHVSFPGGADLDQTKINMPKIHFSIAGNAADGRLSIANPMTNPYIDTYFKSKMDLAKIKQAVYLPEIKKLTGLLNADVKLKGRSSAIEKQEFNKFEAAGHFDLSGMQFVSDSLAYPVNIDVAKLVVTPQALDIKQFETKVGQSDFDIKGKVNNYIIYFLKKDQVLKADLTMHSNFINLNEFMTADESASTEKTQDSLIKIPKNIDLNFVADANKVRYKDMDLNNLKGNIRVKNQKATLQTVLTKAFGGDMSLNGSYDTSGKNAKTAMNIAMKKLAINQTATKLTLFKTYAPVMQKINGNFFSDLQMDVELDKQMNPVLQSLDASGLFNTENINIAGIDVVEKIGKMLKIKALNNPKIDKIKAQFDIQKGRMHVKPFQFKINQINSGLEGTVNLDKKINFILNMDVPRKLLGHKANEIIGNLIGKANALGLKLDMADIIKMKFKITGDYNHPKIIPVIAGAEGQTAQEVVQEAVTQKVEAAVDDAKEKAKAEAQKKADALLAQAQSEADRLKAEAKKAADKIRNEAQKQADALVQKAGNDPFKKLAAQALSRKIKQEAGKKASQLETKAQNQADLIMKDARQKADKLVNKID